MEMELLDNGAIRCVIGQSDLDRHNLTMLDFVIHPESSRPMLQEFIETARRRYGFCCAGNTLIEAVPLAKDRLVLTFSNGQPPFFSDLFGDNEQTEQEYDDCDDIDSEDSRADDNESSRGDSYDDFLSQAKRAGAGRHGAPHRGRRHSGREQEAFRNTRLLMSCSDILGQDNTATASTPASAETEEVVICFRKLDNLMSFAEITGPLQLSSTLFYGAIDRCYVLLINRENSNDTDLRYAGELADEYGTRLFDYSIPYYREYFRCIAEDDALEKLRSVR